MTAPVRVAAQDALLRILEIYGVDPRPGVLFDHVWLQVAHGNAGTDVGRMHDLAVVIMRRFGYHVVHADGRRPGPDLVRAVRDAQLPEPGGCKWCGHVRDGHGRREHLHAGVHDWQAPADGLRRERINALAFDIEAVWA